MKVESFAYAYVTAHGNGPFVFSGIIKSIVAAERERDIAKGCRVTPIKRVTFNLPEVPR